MARDLGAPYTEEKPFYFVSYNIEDVERVKKYAMMLTENGVPIWYDKGLKVGDEWEVEIATRVDDCRAVIMFLSRNIFKKEESYVYKEFELATEYSRKKVYILMLDKIEKPEVPIRFRPWWISVTKSQHVCTYEETTPEESVQMLIEGLKGAVKAEGEGTFVSLETKKVEEQESAVEGEAEADSSSDLEKILLAQEGLLEQRIKDFGKKNPDTLKAMTNVCATYGKMGHYEKALLIAEEVLSLSREVLGEEHPDTIIATNNLAHAYENIGRFGEAYQIQKGVYNWSCRMLGLEHPDTLVAANNLAIALSKMRDHTRALELYKNVYDKRLKMLGEEHPDTLKALENLAIGYVYVDKIRKAIKLQERAYKLICETFGEGHVKAAQAFDNLEKMRKML